jgi:hypothetical protein
MVIAPLSSSVTAFILEMQPLLKSLSESFDGAQDERREFDITDDFPFMLRYSKHSGTFFSHLLGLLNAYFISNQTIVKPLSRQSKSIARAFGEKREVVDY